MNNLITVKLVIVLVGGIAYGIAERNIYSGIFATCGLYLLSQVS